MYTFDTTLDDQPAALLATDLPLPRRRGKVRDVYDLGDRLLIVATDRISAFDHVLPCGIPGKGQLLTALSRFWFDQLATADPPVAHHLISTDVPELPPSIDPQPLLGRVMQVRKATVIPFECVVRGYLEGSGWNEYQSDRSVCGVSLPPGLRRCERLPEPIFTPATKADAGHDENVRFDQMAASIGDDLAHEIRRRSLRIYRHAAELAAARGLLLADTKFEFGFEVGHAIGGDGPPSDSGSLMLIDEVLTPDSSRYWWADRHRPGEPQHALDKQFVREYLLASDWDRQGPPPRLPDAVIRQTVRRYRTALQALTGHEVDPGITRPRRH